MTRNRIDLPALLDAARTALVVISLTIASTAIAKGDHRGDGCKEKFHDKNGHYKFECKGHGYKYSYRADRHGTTEEMKGHPPHWMARHAREQYARHTHVYDDHKSYDQVVVDVTRVKCNREVVGGVIGGIAGGVLGSTIGKGDGRAIATVGGALAGVLIGSSIGRSVDRADARCTGQVLEYASDGQAVAWTGDQGEDYTITPIRTFELAGGKTCREFDRQTFENGQPIRSKGTACQNEAGYWNL